jgi:hypothetical protein
VKADETALTEDVVEAIAVSEGRAVGIVGSGGRRCREARGD